MHRDGVVTLHQALAQGLSRDAVRHRVDSGAWRRAHRGVYVDTDAGARTTARAALAAAGADAVVAGRLAATLHGLQLTQPARPEVLVPRSAARRHKGLVVRRADLRPGACTRRAGLLLTGPARTVADLLLRDDELLAIWACEQALRRRLVTPEQVLAAVGSRPGARTARARLSLARPLAESPLETRLRLLLVHAGLPEPELQVCIRDRSGRVIARVDMYYRAEKVAIEADGAGPHSEPAALYRDRQRQNLLQQAGVTVLRFTWADADPALTAVPAQVEQTLRARRRLAG